MKRTATAPIWPQTTAHVTSCTYRFSRMNTLTLGIPTDRNRFVIGFTYDVDGESYTGEFTSPKYIEQGHVFSIGYDPLHPEQNTKSANAPGKATLFGIGVAGSIVLSLLYLGMMRGCN